MPITRLKPAFTSLAQYRLDVGEGSGTRARFTAPFRLAFSGSNLLNGGISDRQKSAPTHSPMRHGKRIRPIKRGRKIRLPALSLRIWNYSAPDRSGIYSDVRRIVIKSLCLERAQRGWFMSARLHSWLAADIGLLRYSSRRSLTAACLLPPLTTA